MNEVEDPKLLLRVLNVLELILQDCKKYDVFRITEKLKKVTSKRKSTPLGKICSDLAVKCIANHRYKEALKLLWMLCQDKQHIFFPFTFKSLMNVMILESNQDNVKLWKLVCAAQEIIALNKTEIQLEYLMFMLKYDLNDAQRSFLELSSLVRKCALRKHHKVDPIYVAYSDFLDYMNLTQIYYGDTSRSNEILAKVKLAFKNFIENPGEWDIFILKLIKVLETCGEEDEIESILHKYVDSNPDHINSYIYYCTYLYHRKPASENLVSYLKVLADHCPSDERVLWLIEIWNKEDEEYENCLKYVFMFLDYPANGKKLAAWKLLLQVISKVKKYEEANHVIENLWSTRCRSWEWMYFNLQNISNLDEQDKLLISHKISFLRFFNRKHKYIKKVLKRFPDISDATNLLA